MSILNKGNRLRVAALAALIFPAIINGFGQNAAPLTISLRGIGNPQFPTGYWISNSDPHFRHSNDKLFWLSANKVATTFFKEFCCRSGHVSGVKYGAVIFDTAGTRIAAHEWISMPDDPFYVGGGDGFFWARYGDRLEILKTDFTEGARIPLPTGTSLIWSSNGSSFALQKDSKLSIYEIGDSSPKLSVILPNKTRVVDVYGHTVLLNGSRNNCLVGVWQFENNPPPKGDVPVTDVSGRRCPLGMEMLSEDTALIKNYQPYGLEIVHPDGTKDAVSDEGEVLEISRSGRIALQTFHPSHLADVLDMDFGGQKEIAIYDSSTKNAIFRKTIGGQAGAALAPDGRHLAIIEGRKLLIFTIP